MASPATTTPGVQTLQHLQSQATQQAQQLQQNFLAVYFSHLPMLELISVGVSIIFIAAIIYIIIETGWVKLRVSRFRHVVLKTNMSRQRAQEAWKKIEDYFYRGGENDLKVAIMDADKLLNEALRDAGVLGLNVGDRLKKASTEQIPNLDQIWQAHKLRNQIAHESNFKLKRDLAERAIKTYEEALKNLGIFDDRV